MPKTCGPKMVVDLQDIVRDSMVRSIWDMLEFWKKPIAKGLFWETHPTRSATEQFAEFLLPTVRKFLQDNQ